MHLEITNTLGIIRSATVEEISWVRDFLTVDVEVFNGNRKEERSSTEAFSLFDELLGTFPAGFGATLPKLAESAGFEVVVEDTRESVCAIDLDRAHVPWLRDYQWERLKDLVLRGPGILQGVGGSGKTEIMIALTRVLPCEWLYLVNRAELVKQTAERYRLRTGETAGVFEHGGWRKGTCNFTVASFQAVASADRRDQKGYAPKRRGDGTIASLFTEVEGLMVDECHALGAEGMFNTAQHFTAAYHRKGVSATALDREPRERLRIMGALGPIIAEITPKDMESLGVLTPARIRMVPLEQWCSIELSDWREVYSALVLTSERRNALVVAMVERALKPCLVFANELAHGRDLVQRILADGLRVEMVSGSDSTDDRTRKKERLASGETDVLVTTVVFQEGVDIPELASVVVATGQESSVATLQRLFRGTRKHESKPYFELWDVFDRGHHWTEKHAHGRAEAYESRGYTVQLGWD